MDTIPLTAVPNQRLTVRLEGALFDLTIKLAGSLMAATILRNGETVVSGVRCLPDMPLIPHRYLEGMTGNFMFLTEGGRYPHYSRFGGADELVYATAKELEEIRNA